MLRPGGSTLIGLVDRDLNWHRDRYDDRKAKRQAARHNAVKPDPCDERAHGPTESGSRTFTLPIHPRETSSTEPSTAANKESETSLISRDPVPRTSRAFWDQILAEAGTPTRTQVIPTGQPHLVEAPNDGTHNIHSSKASPVSDISDQQESLSGTTKISEGSSDIEDENATSQYKRQHQHSGTSFYSAAAEQTSTESSEPFVTEESAASHRKSRFTGFFQRKGKHGVRDSIFGIPQHRGLGHFDGPPEEPQDSTGSTSGTDVDLNDGLYGSRRDRRTISANWEAYAGDGEPDSRQRASSGHGVETSTSSDFLSPPGEHIRRQPSGVPLHPQPIDKATTASFERQRHALTPVAPSPAPPRSGLLSLPPRRRTRGYRPRSQTYSWVASEDSSGLPQYDGLTASPAIADRRGTDSFQLDPVGAERDRSRDASQHANPSSSPRLPSYHDHSRPSPYRPMIPWSPASTQSAVRITSISSFRSRSSHSNLSPFASPFIPSSSRQPSATLPPLGLPPPFSATRRNVSLTFALPTSSSPAPFPPRTTISPPDNPPTTPPSQRQTSLPFPPRIPSNAPLTPPPHGMTSRNSSSQHTPPPIAIYNDALPATSQPQTPADLRTGGSRFAVVNPFHTAPPRMRGTRSGNGNEYGTPSRGVRGGGRFGGGDGDGEGEGENFGSVTREERVWRRERERRVGIGREERERLRLG